MKDQRLSRTVLRGIVLIAVLMMSSALWADTILLQFLPPPAANFGLGATLTVTPGAEPSQVDVGDFEAGIFASSNAVWYNAGHTETGFVHLTDVNGVHLQVTDSNGNIFDYSFYSIGFTAPGSNVIVNEINVQTVFSSDTLAASFLIRNTTGSLGTCDQFTDSVGRTGVGGECFAYADGQVHDLGLFTGVDNLEIQTPAPDASVPEPSSLLLLGTGLASGLAGLRRKHVTTN
jgi:hypothetical protein